MMAGRGHVLVRDNVAEINVVLTKAKSSLVRQGQRLSHVAF